MLSNRTEIEVKLYTVWCQSVQNFSSPVKLDGQLGGGGRKLREIEPTVTLNASTGGILTSD